MGDLGTGLIQCTVYPMVMILTWKMVTGLELHVILFSTDLLGGFLSLRHGQFSEV